MGIVVVKLSAALICFAQQCAPILYGSDTPTGTFQMQPRKVASAGYDGEVLEFAEDKRYVWAIHRVWTGNPNQMRMYRIHTQTPNDNKITMGCINILPETYVALRDCCSNATLRIEQ